MEAAFACIMQAVSRIRILPIYHTGRKTSRKTGLFKPGLFVQERVLPAFFTDGGSRRDLSPADIDRELWGSPRLIVSDVERRLGGGVA